MKILVTGGCGFIGSNFIRHILAEHEDISVLNLDKLTYCGNPENLKDVADGPGYSFVKGDICDRKLVEDLMGGVDTVVNFAAESHVDRSIKYPEDFLMTNVHGVKVLMEAAKGAGVSKVIQIGTDEVYGSVPEGVSAEDDVLRPNSPYSATKAAGDLLALSYYSTYKLPVIVTRSSNNFGPYQYPEKMMPLFITNLLRGEKVPLYGDGGNVRDWLSVLDNCNALSLILREGKPGEIYNIGGDNCLSNLELTHRILSIMGKDTDRIQPVNDRPGHDRRYALDSSKIKELGWAPEADFSAALRRTVDWYETHKPWWAPLKDRAEIIKW
ncbi:MAG: dTDP-glucose 4,6-dehydratase [Candidatus Omnitrophica bacterium]|nr:dTDP-glucose 4,6-dehydratase [Candidatus Omnitrophota bacterium]